MLCQDLVRTLFSIVDTDRGFLSTDELIIEHIEARTTNKGRTIPTCYWKPMGLPSILPAVLSCGKADRSWCVLLHVYGRCPSSSGRRSTDL